MIEFIKDVLRLRRQGWGWIGAIKRAKSYL